ncbi:MAG: hypothetical protein ACK5SX_15090 [Sandaracinobacter sp.]
MSAFAASSPVLPRLIGLVALVAGIGVGLADWRGARNARAELRVCTGAAGDVRKTLEGCPDVVAAAIDDARRAAECDAAIARDDLYAERASCSEAVKRRGALLAGARAELENARQQLAQAERRTTAAIARAEARATVQARRDADAQSALSHAPRGADGLLTCDAECLRRLSGAPREGR